MVCTYTINYDKFKIIIFKLYNYSIFIDYQ